MSVDPIVERAFVLADRWALEVIRSECDPAFGRPGAVEDQWDFCDASTAASIRLADASQDVQEAAQWLVDRQMAVMVDTGYGGDGLRLREPSS